MGISSSSSFCNNERTPSKTTNATERSRSRGSSFGGSGSSTGANVLILGVLDSIPHRCVIDPYFFDEIKANSNELELAVSAFLTSILMLEWLCIMLSNALRSIKAQSGSSAILSSKDVLRRLFAFHRSSMLEVCRFASKKLVAKVRTLIFISTNRRLF
jgi:hypothetical protein